jgi:hypothetical protein
MTIRILTALLLLVTVCGGQRKVDPKNTYVRVICVVPVVGQGSHDDPKRPQYAPTAIAPGVPGRSGIIGFTQQLSDDGRFSLVEYVARDKSAFQAILNDKQIRVFLKGTDKKDDIEKELKKYRKDFDLNSFGLVMP